MCILKNDNIHKNFTELLKKPTQVSNKVFKNQFYLKIILSKQYKILCFGSRTKVMERIFAKQRKGNAILFTFSKSCKLKVN